jgi:hypothetical protein
MTKESNPRQAIVERVRKNLRQDPRVRLVHEIAATMRPDRLPEPATRMKTTNRAESSKGK